jgi:tight adherence protein C
MPPILLIAIAGVFLMTAVAGGSAASWWFARSAPERRLRSVAPVAQTGIVQEAGALAEGTDPALARLSRLLPKSAKDMSRLQRRLARAGYPQFKFVVYYAFAELLLPVVCGGGVLFFVHMGGAWILALLAAAVGYMLPALYVGRKTELRKKAIENGLPDALDLLTVCVEAGCALDQAVVKAAEELHLAHPALAEELRFVTTETRAGKPRLEAFQNFAKRTGVDDVRTLVAMLTQTDRFGTSISQALRTHSETSRTKRRQRAEERAAKVSVKLVFPLALCLFPSLYVVCFGPVAVRVYRAFFTGAP